jgi:hypothetical protein
MSAAVTTPNKNPPWPVRRAAMLARAERWFRDNVSHPKPAARPSITSRRRRREVSRDLCGND